MSTGITTSADQPTPPTAAPTPSELRAELQRMIVADLLGPVGGEDEELPGRGQVRDRYLVGALAPKGSIGVDPERSVEPVVEGDVVPDLPGEVPDSDQSAAHASMFPSSIGLSCVVVPEITELLFTASWGQYVKEVPEPEELGDEPDAASSGAPAHPGRVWQRYPVEGDVVILLSEGIFGPLPVAAEYPGVVARGRVTKREGFSLVSAFLVNEQEKAATNSDERWLFQARFTLAAVGGDSSVPAFVGRDAALADHGAAGSYDSEDEVALLDLQYRNRVEFGTGHGTAVHVVLATAAEDVHDPTRACRLETQVIPSFEVPRTEAPNAEEEPMLASAVLDMATLAQTPQASLRAALEPLVDAYEAWIDTQATRPGDSGARLAGHDAAIEVALITARLAAARIRAGIEVLAQDANAAEAFSFANEAMWRQRVRTVATARRRASGEEDDDESFDLDAALDSADLPVNRSWRPFQLAFILLNIPALTDPIHPERLHESGLVDLLFFPTGGGKTEAYLGLTAFTLAIRRLQGTVAGHGPEGVAVLMRYTLRLLTSDQFSRASALICACEVIRRAKVAKDSRWGDTPFRIGLWVGSSLTPNRGKESQAAIEEQRSGKRVRGSQPVVLMACPWCGRRLDTGADARYDPDRWRTLVFCGDPLGACPFTEGASNKEGLPVVTVDEEIYRLLPALLISTADKWAQLPLKGPLHLLFGRAARRCERHGYRSAELDITSDRTETDKHNKTAQLPSAKTLDCDPLRPPDLIIQDELHLLAGPLGTLVGLYEAVIDELASWQVGETTVRPKVIASTATVRRAAQQVHALFWRGLAVFPPPVLDVEDSFFARQRAVVSGDEGKSASVPGRLYLGICAPGQRMASVETRVFTTVLAAAQVLYERYGAAADPWMTMVAYFSALRELGGAKRLVEDDVRSRLRNAEKRGLAQRSGMVVRELTSRISSGEVGGRLDELMVRFDPDAPEDSAKPIDVLLATNMISVGVDVARLGLMVCVGQPKATAEYIQATSRVGRTDAGPGLVISLYNWARPRDFSHYETFEHYHSTYYRQVEALSVTPFAIRALDRGLTAVFVALLRQHLGSVADWNPNSGAQAVVTTGHPVVSEAIDRLATRAENVSGKPGMAAFVRAQLQHRLDEWNREQLKAAGGGATLGYQDKATVAGLLSTPTVGDWPLWAVPNSLREVEPTINLIIDEKDWSIEHPRPWAPAGTGAAPPSQPTVEDPDPGSEGEFEGDLLDDAGVVAP
jgi:hypothetical protein